jgi:acyl carrier protein
MALNARELGLQRTVDQLRAMLVEKFHAAQNEKTIKDDEPIFSAGVGLSSLEGMELLAELENRFDVKFDNLEHWVEESPTITAVAQYLIDRSPE